MKETVRREVRAEGEDLEELLVAFLGELLYLHDAEGLLFRRARVLEGPDRQVRAEVLGEPFDPGRHRIERQIKAVTYHGLRVQKTRGAWRATVILDI